MKQVRLGECLQQVATWNPVRNDKLETFTYIDIGAVDQQHKKIIKPQTVKCAEAPSRARQLVKLNDVLVSTVRPNLNAVALIQEELDNATASTGFCVLRANTELIEPAYLFNWVKSARFVSEMVKKATGASYPAVSDKIICDSIIKLPSLLEQKKTAAILDKAAKVREKRAQVAATLDDLVHSKFIQMFGHPATNSKKLPLVKLGEIGSWHSGGTPSRTRKKYFEGELPWFSSGELNSMYVYESIEHISEDAIKNTAAKLVKQGSLMLGMYDTAALKTSIAGKDCSCNQAIAFAEIDASIISTTYAYHAILIGREHFRRLQRGVRQKNLNLDLIKNIQIPKPLQKDLDNFESFLHEVIKARKENAKAYATSDELFASLQHQAFTTGFTA